MKLTPVQMDRMVRSVLAELQKQNIISYKAPEDKIHRRAVQALEENMEQEREIDREASRMVEDLERKNPGQFERHKMFLMIKKKLAQEKKFVL